MQALNDLDSHEAVQCQHELTALVAAALSTFLDLQQPLVMKYA
jgi:hypothetical protein